MPAILRKQLYELPDIRHSSLSFDGLLACDEPLAANADEDDTAFYGKGPRARGLALGAIRQPHPGCFSFSRG